jgi:hypothetical protein
MTLLSLDRYLLDETHMVPVRDLIVSNALRLYSFAMSYINQKYSSPVDSARQSSS